MHVLSYQRVHITHTYCCVSKLSKFGAYLYAVNDKSCTFWLWDETSGSASEGYRMFAFLSIDVKRDLIECLR